MPIAPRPRCKNKSCPNKAGVNSTRCDSCRLIQARKYDRRRRNGYARGSTSKWQRFRIEYLACNPRCMCDTCMLQPYWARPLATDIDHIDGTGRDGPRAYDLSNLRAMSHEHHSQRTAKDQPGGWHAAWRDKQQG